MRYIIGLGGNKGDSSANFDRAVLLLGEYVGAVGERSTWQEYEALVHPEWPIDNPPPYLNGIVLLESELSAAALLQVLFRIERELGRRREEEKIRWGPRIIDLDIIACDERVVQSDALLIPHPEMHKRGFVLQPMLEVAPDWKHPILGKTTTELLKALASLRERGH